jgi:hypothetical protein
MGDFKLSQQAYYSPSTRNPFTVFKSGSAWSGSLWTCVCACADPFHWLSNWSKIQLIYIQLFSLGIISEKREMTFVPVSHPFFYCLSDESVSLGEVEHEIHLEPFEPASISWRRCRAETWTVDGPACTATLLFSRINTYRRRFFEYKRTRGRTARGMFGLVTTHCRGCAHQLKYCIDLARQEQSTNLFG